MSEALVAEGSIEKMQPSVCLISQSNDGLYAAGDHHYYKHTYFSNLDLADDKYETSRSSNDLFHLHFLDGQSSSNTWVSPSDYYYAMIRKRLFGMTANPQSIEIPTRKVSWQTVNKRNLPNQYEARFEVLMKRSETSHKALQLTLPKDMSTARLKKSMLQASYSRKLLQKAFYEKRLSVAFAGPLIAAQGHTAFEL